MTKRKASESHLSPQNTFRSKAACFTVPTWVLHQQNDQGQSEIMMTSPPPSAPIHQQQDMEMTSPTQKSFWKSLHSSPKNQPLWPEFAPVPVPVPAPEPSHPLYGPKMIPKDQFDAVVGEVSSLKQTIAWLTRELNESRSKVAQLEQQAQFSGMGQDLRRSTGTPLATGFQGQVFLESHGFGRMPGGGGN